MVERTTPPRVQPDTIFDFDTYSQGRNFQDALGRLIQIGSYSSFLNYFHNQFVGPLPPVPATPPPLPTRFAVINSGRWLWLCNLCNSWMFCNQGELSICVACGGVGWVRINFPFNRVALESELLKQPGRLDNAPIREWRPGWTLADLEGRTRRAQERIARGETVRSLSIGATRNWAVSEVLTAGNMNSFISDPIDDLAGRNGEVQIEGPFKVNDGAGQYLDLPSLTTTQRDALTPNDGMLIYNSTLGLFQRRENGIWMTSAGVLADGSIIIGDGVGDAVALSAFTSSTGQLKHENGGIEANISSITTGEIIVGQSAGVAGLETPMSQAQAEAGTDTQVRGVTAQRTKQAIDALGGIPLTANSFSKIRLFGH